MSVKEWFETKEEYYPSYFEVEQSIMSWVVMYHWLVQVFMDGFKLFT